MPASVAGHVELQSVALDATDPDFDDTVVAYWDIMQDERLIQESVTRIIVDRAHVNLQDYPQTIWYIKSN